MGRVFGIAFILIGLLFAVGGISIMVFAEAETLGGQLITGGAVVLLGLFLTAPVGLRFACARASWRA